ncbi:uncharacterized protein LOC133886445 [Phragmites australis]|uniref:uncharacterized protein LOC133886445 n=1 Tax=Phragmites australis TaxID=29695 RepID=UPI002D793052|nr:uncharacterized protein LOC133886445 [Phragmites australis]
MERQEEDLAMLIPDDVLEEVFRRVAPRGLAASRCVCRAWRALIDDRRLLRADLLPRTLAGLFLCFNMLELPEFFARPAVGFTVYRMHPGMEVDDHCNGLVLQCNCVLNPATGRRAYLPERPLPLLEEYFTEDDYLAFDPTESPHYHVFLIPMVLLLPTVDRKLDPVYSAISQSEWPPSPFVLSVFSSRTGRWEKRSLVREGEAAGTVADMDDQHWVPRHSVCWRGALYVHRQNDFVMRISLSNHTYRVIKPPREIEMLRGRSDVHLGRSQKGVYYAFIDDKYHLWVWILDDSCDQMEWILKHHSGCGLALPNAKCNQENYGPWILQNANCDEADNNEALAGQEFEWDSDDENILHTEDRIQEQLCFTILGFHPYKEIVFLHRSSRGLAYHLKSSKLEYLGNLYPKDYTHIAGSTTEISFRAMWMTEYATKLVVLVFSFDDNRWQAIASPSWDDNFLLQQRTSICIWLFLYWLLLVPDLICNLVILDVGRMNLRRCRAKLPFPKPSSPYRRVMVLTANIGENREKKFYRCLKGYKSPSACMFFKWEDEYKKYLIENGFLEEDTQVAPISVDANLHFGREHCRAEGNSSAFAE